MHIICHLTLAVFLHYLTLHKNRNAILTSRDFDTWDHISQGIIDEAIDQCGKHSCMHVQRQMNVTSNTYCDLATQLAQSHFRLVFFIATHTIERKIT